MTCDELVETLRTAVENEKPIGPQTARSALEVIKLLQNAADLNRRIDADPELSQFVSRLSMALTNSMVMQADVLQMSVVQAADLLRTVVMRSAVELALQSKENAPAGADGAEGASDVQAEPHDKLL